MRNVWMRRAEPRFRRVPSIFLWILVTLAGPITVFAQASDAKARAREILDQTRAALGGDAALKAVQSLSAVGDFRSGSGNTQASGEVQLDLLLPDKLMRTLKPKQFEQKHG